MFQSVPLDFIFEVPVYVQLVPLILFVNGVLCFAWVVEAIRYEPWDESGLSVGLSLAGMGVMIGVAISVFWMLSTETNLLESFNQILFLPLWLPMPVPVWNFLLVYYFGLIWQYKYYLFIDAVWTYGILIGSTIWVSRKVIWEMIKTLAFYLFIFLLVVVGLLAAAYYWSVYYAGNLPMLLFTTLTTLLSTFDPLASLTVYGTISESLFRQALPWLVAVDIGASAVVGLIIYGIYKVFALIVNFLRSTRVGRVVETGVSVLVSLSVGAISVIQAFFLQSGGSISTLFTPYTTWMLLFALL